MTESRNAYEGWAIVELMGHRRLAGQVSQAEQYGVAMLRLDIPAVDEQPAATQFYGGTSIYCITPTTEEIARGIAEHNRPAPVNRWELPEHRAIEALDPDDVVDCEIADDQDDDEDEF